MAQTIGERLNDIIDNFLTEVNEFFGGQAAITVEQDAVPKDWVPEDGEFKVDCDYHAESDFMRDIFFPGEGPVLLVSTMSLTPEEIELVGKDDTELADDAESDRQDEIMSDFGASVDLTLKINVAGDAREPYYFQNDPSMSSSKVPYAVRYFGWQRR